ncbi:MAG: ParB/RepB/Spo0J family partition protein [Bacteroidales bacterium]|nr:ParB/RepB/Spo0J family partition protein [Bacteroidales bacterium]
MAGSKKTVLGRGLGALITMDDLTTGGSSSINEVELSKIHPNPDQPRTFFDQEALEELAASIRSLGIVQPITLREISEDSYQIISGERRYRASLLAGLTTVPAYIKTAEDDNVMEMALIENIQREDLNAIEISLAYQKLLDIYHLTQEQLSDRIGKKRATVANYLRLLKLPAEIQIGLKNKLIDMGHARALVSVTDPALQLDIYEKILKQHLSVRNVEEMVRKMNAEEDTAKEKIIKQKEQDFLPLQSHLSKFFKTDVQLICNKKGKGKITIAFASDSELERIIGLLDGLKD